MVTIRAVWRLMEMVPLSLNLFGHAQSVGKKFSKVELNDGRDLNYFGQIERHEKLDSNPWNVKQSYN